MEKIINHFFTFLSYGVLNRTAVRFRTQLAFTQFVLINILTIQFLVLRIRSASGIVAGVVLIISTTYPWLIGRIVDSYVNNNWRLFSPRTKDRVHHLWAYRTAVYVLFLLSLALMGLAGYWWGKNNEVVKQERIE